MANLKKEATVETVNQALTKASQSDYKDILVVEKDELVSSDFNGCPASSTVDIPSTQMIGSRLVKVLAWYDNETGFSNRMVDLALLMTKQGL